MTKRLTFIAFILAAAKVAGVGDASFTATHLNGFMQWQSNRYPYAGEQQSSGT